MKPNQKFLLIAFLFLASSWNLYSNGGPIDGSIIYKTGDPHLLQISDVELISEKLELSIHDDFTDVHVTYRLHNRSNQLLNKIYYGFPVDYVYSDCCDTLLTEDYIHSLVFKYNGKKLTITDAPINPNKTYKGVDFPKLSTDNGEYANWQIETMKRKWFYTQFSIPANDLITLEVTYTLKNSFEDWATSKSFYTSYSDRKLSYDFSPAAYWGNGIVKDFQVIINSSENLQIAGLSLKQEKNVYTFSQVDFDFRNADPLTISYDVSAKKLSKEFNSLLLKRKNIQSIKASSSLKNYPVENLLDRNPATAWAEGRPDSGINEWIEIVPDSNFSIAGVLLVNGYTKSEKTYYENNRIKQLKVKIDYPEENYWGDPDDGYIIDLEDRPYQAIDKNNFAAMATILLDGGDGGRRIKKIRLTILDVYKGTTYDDTCISEIYVSGYNWADY
ncbi:MAG: hypothetical protein LBN18_07910 [Dysgonamonadaceae bacterium]|jgi:hypothetical protein|nr:hypothetical protein [Dysgonamonadaceae bacterium]